jgi:hypothetical protein
VVSGHHVDRHRKRRQELADALVLARPGDVDEVAADQDRVGERRQIEYRADGRRQREGRVAVAPADIDVRIAELGE